MEKKQDWKKCRKRDVTVYFVLRAFVILTIAIQAIRGNWENVFLGILTLVLFLIPSIIEHRLKIKLPDTLEIIILLFIFSAEILGEIQNFYGIFPQWDTMLHTINGFLCAAIGFSLIDILNRSKRFHSQMTPAFVALVAFCFSMTIGVLWEFFEFGMDEVFRTDMQKDRVVTSISSVELNENKENVPVVIEQIEETKIRGKVGKEEKEIVISGGYLEIGLRDTIKDLLVNFVGAVVFSFLGLLYIKDRDEYKFAENFIPIMKTEEEIEETKKELQRLEAVLQKKKEKKQSKEK